MKIAVIGAGAMGSLFGAWLSSVASVWLIDIDDAHVRAIRKRGLTVETPQNTLKTYFLQAVTPREELPIAVDLALIFTKSYDTENAAKTAEKVLDNIGIALTLQNGIGNHETLCRIIGSQRVMVGVTSQGGTLLGPGRVRHGGTGPTYLSAHPERYAEIAETFNAAGIETHVSENLQGILWGKLVVNAAINALAAILRVSNGTLEKYGTTRSLMKKAVAETVLVAETCGISLPWEDPVSRAEEVCRATSNNRASMLQDILQGRRTEVRAIYGAIAEKAETLGIDAPYVRFLMEIIEALEETSGERIT